MTTPTMLTTPAPVTRSKRGWHDPWRTAFFVLAVVALVVGVGWALLGSSLFVVRTIQVSGPGSVSRAAVLKAARIKIGTPLVRVDTAAVAHRVDQITQVQSARVRRSWPDSVLISTVPRTPTFLVRAGAGRDYDIADSYGVILGSASSRPAGLVLLQSITGPVTGLRRNPAVLAIGTVVRALPAWLRQRVTAARAVRPSRVVLILRGGVTVAWGSPGWTAAKAEEVSVLLHTKASYDDVSDPESAATGWPGRG
jgi:cell division protein FtsQ